MAIKTNDKGLHLLDIEAMKAIVREKLNADYFVVMGDNHEIMKLENTVYTPKTFRNDFFQLIFTASIPLRFFYLAKKIPELYDFLPNDNIKNLLSMEFRNGTVDCGFLMPNKSKKKNVDRIIEFLFEEM